jgi:fucose 4-O-acetylase-like acetyltransferase
MKTNRMLYLDNIRLTMIILVILLHIAVTYSGFGSWYYVEPGELDTIQMVIFAFFQTFTQAFFMGLLFLIAGYFVPDAYDKKGFGKFIKARFIRLGIPSLIYMVIINPVLLFGVMGYRIDTSGYSGGGSLVATYVEYIIGFHFIGGNGPLWFALALLIFSVIYALFRKLMAREIVVKTESFPGNRKILALMLLISVSAFLIRLVQPLGTDILNMQLGYFASYIILFIAGINCKRNGWFEELTYKTGKLWLICGTVLGFVLFLVIMIGGGALTGDLMPFEGGMTWQSAAYATWESFVAVAISIGLLAFFKEKYNKQSGLIKLMSQNAFAVYVFHSVIIVAISLLFAPVILIPIAKFALVAIVGVPACFLIIHFTIGKVGFLRRLFS